MDDMNTENPMHPSDPVENNEPELSHSDKMVGVFTEPSATFEQAAKFPPRTVDWLLPMFIIFLLVAASNIILMNNDQIAYEVKEKQREKMEEGFSEAVKEGRMTQQEAEDQMNEMEKRMDVRSPFAIVITFVSTLVGGFIFFFLMVLVYYLFSRFVLKGDGNYSSALVSLGLPAYITIIQVVLAAVISFTLGRLVNDTSAAALMNADRSTLLGWFLAKIDPISIWSYIVVGIGLAKMFKSSDTRKYIIMVFSVWILGTLLLHFIANAVPFLKMFR